MKTAAVQSSSDSQSARGVTTSSPNVAVVVIGPGQVVTTIVLRAMGWHVELASSVVEANEIACELNASLMFVRIGHSHLRSLRRPSTFEESLKVVAIVDSAEDTALPGFDATIAADDVQSITAFIREAARQPRSHSGVVPIAEYSDHHFTRD